MKRPPGSWYLAPSTDLSDEWAAGYDDNVFASESEAEDAIPGLVYVMPDDCRSIEWVAVQRPASKVHP